MLSTLHFQAGRGHARCLPCPDYRGDIFTLPKCTARYITMGFLKSESAEFILASEDPADAVNVAGIFHESRAPMLPSASVKKYQLGCSLDIPDRNPNCTLLEVKWLTAMTSPRAIYLYSSIMYAAECVCVCCSRDCTLESATPHHLFPSPQSACPFLCLAVHLN